MWSSSSFQRLLQRQPSGPTQAQRPPSRFHTARRTIAGIVVLAAGGFAAVFFVAAAFVVPACFASFVFRSGATAPLAVLFDRAADRLVEHRREVAVRDLVRQKRPERLEVLL